MYIQRGREVMYVVVYLNNSAFVCVTHSRRTTCPTATSMRVNRLSTVNMGRL